MFGKTKLASLPFLDVQPTTDHVSLTWRIFIASLLACRLDPLWHWRDCFPANIFVLSLLIQDHSTFYKLYLFQELDEVVPSCPSPFAQRKKGSKNFMSAKCIHNLIVLPQFVFLYKILLGQELLPSILLQRQLLLCYKENVVHIICFHSKLQP